MDNILGTWVAKLAARYVFVVVILFFNQIIFVFCQSDHVKSDYIH